MKFSEDTAAIDEAMAKARGEFLPIDKERTADTGTFKYEYADLSDIFFATTPAMSKYGLVLISDVWVHDEPLASCSQSWIRHSSGQWYESSVLKIPTTVNGKMGPAQLLGSSQSYGRRYQVLGLLGIQPRREDDDGHGASGTDASTTSRPSRAPDPNAPSCPQCGKSMSKRNGSKGEFWGCRGYPECRGTLPVHASSDPAAAHDQGRQQQSGEDNQAPPTSIPLSPDFIRLRDSLYDMGVPKGNVEHADKVCAFAVPGASMRACAKDAALCSKVLDELIAKQTFGSTSEELYREALSASAAV